MADSKFWNSSDLGEGNVVTLPFSMGLGVSSSWVDRPDEQNIPAAMICNCRIVTAGISFDKQWKKGKIFMGFLASRCFFS